MSGLIVHELALPRDVPQCGTAMLDFGVHILSAYNGDKQLPLDAILVFRVDLAADLAGRIIETVNVDVGAPIAKAFK